MANYNSSHTGAEIDSAIGRVKDTAVTAGTVSASLGVVVDANKDISGFRNVTLTGQLQAATINLTGDTTIGDGDTDNITINADVNSNIIPNTDNTFDLGSASKQWKDLYVNGIGYIDQLGTDADPIAIYASSGEIDGTAIGSESASTGAFTTISASGNVDFNGDLDVDGTTNLDVVDIDGAVDMASTLAVGTYFSLKTTDDQANSWVLYTHTNDSLEFNYNGSGNAEVVVDNSGKVGIGTTSPSKPLHISSAENQVARFESTDAYAGIELKDNGSSTLPPLISALSDDILFYGGNASARPLIMTLDSSTGNVGIGDTSPSYKLEVKGNIGIQRSTNTEVSEITMEAGQFDIKASPYGYAHRFFNGTSGTSTEKMRITTDGKVGIGQTTVNAMLDIDDGGANTGIGVPQIRVGSINNTGVYGLIGFGWGGNTTYSPVTIGGLGTSGSGSVEADFVINTRDGTSDAVPVERMRVTHDGNVGIGDTSPSTALTSFGSASKGLSIKNQQPTISFTDSDVTKRAHIGFDGNNENFIISSPESSGIINFQAGGFNNRMTITSGGDVGIGTTTGIDSLLHVKSINQIITLESTSATGRNYIMFKDNSADKGFIGYGSGSNDDFSIYQYDNAKLKFATNGGVRWEISASGTFQPSNDNYFNIGSSGLRVSVIYTANSVNVSDKTLKENIADCSLGVDFINTLKPKSYKMKGLKEGHDDYNRKHFGLIAQDLIDTELNDSVFGDKDGEYSLAYNDIIAPLIKAVQELSAQNDLLTARIEALEA